MYACSAIPPGNFLVGDKRKIFRFSCCALYYRCGSELGYGSSTNWTNQGTQLGRLKFTTV